jgi:hypothetical protein
LVWPNEAVAQVFSAHDFEGLRGPQFDAAWIDEIGCWAIDKATNQPNKLLDRKSSDGALPKYSNGGAIRLFRCNICGSWRSSGENRTTTRKPRFMRARWSIPIGCLSGHVTCGPFRIFWGIRRFGVIVRTMRAGIGCRTVFLRGQRGTDGAIPDVWPVGSVLVVLDTSACSCRSRRCSAILRASIGLDQCQRPWITPRVERLSMRPRVSGRGPISRLICRGRAPGAGDVAVSWNGNRALTAIFGI